jgi:hypothetical protein
LSWISAMMDWGWEAGFTVWVEFFWLLLPLPFWPYTIWYKYVLAVKSSPPFLIPYIAVQFYAQLLEP